MNGMQSWDDILANSIINAVATITDYNYCFGSTWWMSLIKFVEWSRGDEETGSAAALWSPWDEPFWFRENRGAFMLRIVTLLIWLIACFNTCLHAHTHARVQYTRSHITAPEPRHQEAIFRIASAEKPPKTVSIFLSFTCKHICFSFPLTKKL